MRTWFHTAAAAIAVNNIHPKNATNACLKLNVFPALDIACGVNGNNWHTVKDPLTDRGNSSLRGFGIPAV